MRIELLALVTLLLAGCAGQTFVPEEAPEYVVTSPETPLYHLGPAQGSAPEAHIPRDERVKMLRREFGYSFVQMSDGLTGYVANMDLAPAPARPRPPVTPESGSPLDYSPPAPPMVIEPPLPKPDMDVAPADAPPNN